MYLLSLILVIQVSYGLPPNKIIACLGKEEYTFFQKKIGGPLVSLNQKLLNEMAYLSDITIKDKYVESICNSEDQGPTLALLEHFIIHGIKIFNIKGKDRMRSAQKKVIVQNFLENLPEIYFNYLSGLQYAFESPDCLLNEVPELRIIWEKFQYLDLERAHQSLTVQNDLLLRVLNKTRHLEYFYQKCAPLPKKSNTP